MEELEIILKKLFEIIQTVIVNWCSEELYLQFASGIFLIAIWFKTIFWETDGVSGFAKDIYSALLILLFLCMSIMISQFLMLKIEKYHSGLIKKYSIYEKRGRHYYLKEEYILFRKIFSIFSNGTVDIIVVVLIMIIKYFNGEYEFLEHMDVFLAWGYLKWNYFSGITYKENISNMQDSQKEMNHPLLFLSNMISKTMKQTIYGMKTIRFPIKYGIQYPDNSFKKEYQELYVSLMDEKNIYVEDIFYHDWDWAFIIPMNTMLLKNRKVVIFTGAAMEPEKLLIWLQEKIRLMMGLEKSWKIKIWDNSVINYDICIVSAEALRNFIEAEISSSILAYGVFCVMLEPSRIVAEMRDCLENYADYLAGMEVMPIYCFADRYVEGLLDYLSHVFRCKIENVEVQIEHCKETKLCFSHNSDNDETKAYWGMLDRSGPGAVYFTELFKAYAPYITYVSRRIVPVKDMCIRLKNKIPVHDQEAAHKINSMLSKVSFCTSIWEVEQRDEQYIIVDDEDYNCYDLGWYLSMKSNVFNSVFILSGQYFLLDFMLKHTNWIQDIRNSIPILFPVYQDTERNQILKIIRKASKKRMVSQGVAVDIKEIYEVFPILKNKSKREIKSKLNEIFLKYYNIAAFEINMDVLVLSLDFLRLNRILWEEAFFIDEERKEKVLGGKLACHLDQIFMEGQYIVYSGCCYQIVSINQGVDGKEIFLGKSQAYWETFGFNYQDRQYELSDIQVDICTDLKENICIKKCTASICVNTFGWYQKNCTIYDEQIDKRQQSRVPKRKYRNKTILFLEFKDNTIEDGIIDTLCQILDGISRTIYPYHYPYLWFLKKEDHLLDGKNIETRGIFIIEDCEDDLGLIDSIERNIEKLLNLCYEYSKQQIEGGI